MPDVIPTDAWHKLDKELVKRLREPNGKGVHAVGYSPLINPDGPEAADAIEALQAEVERLTFDGIHTCHDDCPRLPCVQRREIDALRAENSMLAAGACINPGQHALVGDEHGNFVCTAYEALQAEERAHADALAKVAELESWKVAEEAHHHLLRAEIRHLMNELQAHKDALAQVKGSSDD